MLSVGGAVVVAHSALGERIGDDPAMCLAVIAAGGAALLALTAVRAALLRAPLSRLVGVAPRLVALPAPSPAPRSRAGPAVLQVFLR